MIMTLLHSESKYHAAGCAGCCPAKPALANTVTTVIPAAGPHRPDLPVNATNQPLLLKEIDTKDLEFVDLSICRFVFFFSITPPFTPTFSVTKHG